MWKTLSRTLLPVVQEAPLLKAESCLIEQLRTTFILKRRNPPMLHRFGSKPKKLRARHFIYDVIEDTNIKPKQDMQVILTANVSGLGSVGDLVSVRPHFAYNKLLVPGLAVYASPEYRERYKVDERKTDVETPKSSPSSQKTAENLAMMTLNVTMNKDTPWTIKPWHIKTMFRKSGVYVPEEAIKMSPTPITGPNMENEGKEFYVTVTVNKTESVNVRCLLHHWSTSPVERLPYVSDFWKEVGSPIHPEDAEILDKIPARIQAKVHLTPS